MVTLLNPTVAEKYEATVEADIKIVCNNYNGKLSLLPPVAVVAAEAAGFIKKKAASKTLTPKPGAAPAETADSK